MNHYYYVREWKSFIDDFYIDHKIKKWKFGNWQVGKIKLANDENVEHVSIEEAMIIETICLSVDLCGYILCKNIEMDNISKAKISNTIEDEQLLGKYRLKRVRATKTLKQEHNIDSKGYPNIIIRF